MASFNVIAAILVSVALLPLSSTGHLLQERRASGERKVTGCLEDCPKHCGPEGKESQYPHLILMLYGESVIAECVTKCHETCKPKPPPSLYKDGDTTTPFDEFSPHLSEI